MCSYSSNESFKDIDLEMQCTDRFLDLNVTHVNLLSAQMITRYAQVTKLNA